MVQTPLLNGPATYAAPAKRCSRQRTEAPAGYPRFSAWVTAVALGACSWLAACAGQEPSGDHGAAELRAFLEGATPPPGGEAEARALGEAFAEQSVRAYGYRKSGVGDAEEDGWSPVIRRRGDAAEPADVSAWVDAGDIDASGRFAPRGDLCEGMGPFPTDGLPGEAQALDRLQDRLGALSCALSRLSGDELEISWVGPSQVALSLSGDGAVLVNPRVLHLIPIGQLSAGRPLDAPGAAVEDAPRGAAPPPAPTGLAPASAAEEPQGFDDHPRPKSKPKSSSRSSSRGVCDSVCDDLFNDTFKCDSDSSGSSSGCGKGSGGSSSSGCGKGGGSSSSSSCGKCSESGGESGDTDAAALSLIFLAALLLRRRPTRRLGGVVVLAIVLLTSYPAFAQQPEWKKRQQDGIEHFQKKRYEEAIVDLEAAHELSPSQDKLEKIAAAKKELNKYPGAIATLERLLDQFGDVMTAARQKQVKDEIERLRAALVPLRLVVIPAQAEVSVDGDVLPPDAVSRPIPLAPGKHTITARLDGFEQGVKAINLEPGSTLTAITLKLKADKAFVVVRAPAPWLHIAIDGKAVGTGTWTGLLPPGRHLVQIYPANGPAQSYFIDAEAGKNVEVPPAAAPPLPSPPPSREPERRRKEKKEPSGPPTPSIRGPYILGNATLLWQTARPYGFEHGGVSAPGFALGGRLGYRVGSPVGLELLAEYGRVANGGEVVQVYDIDRNGDRVVDGGEDFTDASGASYILQSIRIGPQLRLMTTGPVDRFVGGIGLGALYELIDLDHANIVWDAAAQAYRNEGTFFHDYSGWTPYLLLEGGYERSVGNLLLGGFLQATVEAIGSLPAEPYNSSAQSRIGLSFRVGYATWSRAGARPVQAASRPPSAAR